MISSLSVKDWFEIVSAVVAIVVIPFTLFGIWRSRLVSQQAENWRARQEEIGTYNDINNRYADFLKLLLANPEVDIGEFGTPRTLTDEKAKYKRNLMYASLVSLMERAFLLYKSIDKFDLHRPGAHQGTCISRFLERAERRLFGQSPLEYQTHIFKSQWPGWEKYFRHYCSLKPFQEYWNQPSDEPSLPTQWQDSDFEKFVNGLIKQAVETQRTERGVSAISQKIRTRSRKRTAAA